MGKAPVANIEPLGAPPAINLAGMTAKAAVFSSSSGKNQPVSKIAKMATLMTISATVTYWKRMRLRGFVSCRGMNTGTPQPSLPVHARHPRHVGLALVIRVARGDEQKVGEAIDVAK